MHIIDRHTLPIARIYSVWLEVIVKITVMGDFHYDPLAKKNYCSYTHNSLMLLSARLQKLLTLSLRESDS